MTKSIVDPTLKGQIVQGLRVNYANLGDGLYVVLTWQFEKDVEYQFEQTTDGINYTIAGKITGQGGGFTITVHTVAVEPWPRFRRLT